MRTAIALFALLTACSTTYECDECCSEEARQIVYRFVDSDEDGLPDSRTGWAVLGESVFEDTNDDGLPDTRLHADHGQDTFVFHLQGDDSTAVFVDTDDDGLPDRRAGNRDRNRRIELALRNLERAIAEVRRAMR